jgi:hypothetical protein
MATRMQQRRGTAAQWTAANPTLAAGEIGFETDTNKFKMGNGSSNWAALTYFANTAGLEALLNDGAPAALNTLNEIAAAINDDPAFFTTIASQLATHSSDTTNIHGITDTTVLATQTFVTDAISGVTGDFATMGGVGLSWNAGTEAFDIDDTVATKTYADTGLSTHSTDTTAVHGIADTSLLATTADITTHNSDTTDVHGIADTVALATKTYADSAVSTHSSDTTSVHGIADTSALAIAATVATDISTAVSTHSSDTTSVHGIADTAALATTSGVSTSISTHNSATTSVHGIADTSLLALKSEVSAVTATTLGLGNVTNTSDANKPVSTAQSTAIATAKAEAIADATAQVNALLTGAPAALNTLDELAAALGDDANFAASVTTSLGLKVDSLTPISQKTASYTLSSLTERDDLIEMNSASALVLTIPTDATLDFPIGTSIDILQTGAGQVTVAPVSGTVTVNATPGLKLRTTWSSATLFKRAANTWVVFGDLTA